MGFFSNLFRRDRTSLRMGFMSFGGDMCSPAFTIDLTSNNGLNRAYYECEPVSTIIGRNASALANAKWWIVDEKDNDISDRHKDVFSLIKNPNPLQTTTEFFIQLDTYLQLKGEVFVFAPAPVGYGPASSKAMWVINPDYIEVELTNKLYKQSDINEIVKAYYLNVDGERTLLDSSCVLHIKDTYQNVNFNPTDIRGCSRLVGLEHPIKNIVQANEAVYAINRDRGAMGILSNVAKDAIGAMPLDPKEKDRIQKEYLEGYGLKAGQRKVIITDASLQWQQMSFNVKDLMLFEGMEKNVQRIADALQYPYELLGNTRGVTHANKKEAKAWHYQDRGIPIARLYGEKFTGFFGLEKAFIVPDYSEVEVLKEAESEKAETKKKLAEAYSIPFKLKVISAEEYRLALGLDENIYGNTFYNEEETNGGGDQGTQS